MFHRSSLLMTALVLIMGVAWVGIEHFGLAEPSQSTTVVAGAAPETPEEIRFKAAAARYAPDEPE
ncbi:MAG: hypothetical protein SGJ21_01935 [Alphaproteobacteria bacterium]|nr:hypothetical protein [Alphaproteobacteria bacterium]